MKLFVFLLALIACAFATPTGRIVGGSDAQRHQFKYQVSLQRLQLLVVWSHSCGGSIISRKWILTAAHCIDATISSSNYRIVAGILNLDDTNSERQIIGIRRSILHELYPGGTEVAPNDIAVLELESDLVYNDAVEPIRLPAAGYEALGTATLSGWGSMGGSILFPRMPNTLQQITIPIVPNNECNAAILNFVNQANNRFDFDANLCTGPLTGGISACSGDSGGPLAHNGEVIGVVSWGITPCGSTGAPSVYTKVSNYISWIRNHAHDL